MVCEIDSDKYVSEFPCVPSNTATHTTTGPEARRVCRPCTHTRHKASGEGHPQTGSTVTHFLLSSAPTCLCPTSRPRRQRTQWELGGLKVGEPSSYVLKVPDHILLGQRVEHVSSCTAETLYKKRREPLAEPLGCPAAVPWSSSRSCKKAAQSCRVAVQIASASSESSSWGSSTPVLAAGSPGR